MLISGYASGKNLTSTISSVTGGSHLMPLILTVRMVSRKIRLI